MASKKILVVDIDKQSMSRMSDLIKAGHESDREIFSCLLSSYDELRVILYAVHKYNVDTVYVCHKMYLFTGDMVIQCLEKFQERLRAQRPAFKNFFIFDSTGLVTLRSIRTM